MRSSPLAFAGFLTCVLCISSSAAAQPSPRPEPGSLSEWTSARSFYGWEVLLADVPAYVLLAATDPYDTQIGGKANLPLLGLSAAAYLLGGPIVHAANDRSGASLASLGIRAGSLAAGFGAAYLLHGCHDYPEPEEHDSCASGLAMFTGFAIAGSAIDAFALGWRLRTPPERPRSAAWLTLGPRSVGVVGRF